MRRRGFLATLVGAVVAKVTAPLQWWDAGGPAPYWQPGKTIILPAPGKLAHIYRKAQAKLAEGVTAHDTVFFANTCTCGPGELCQSCGGPAVVG